MKKYISLFLALMLTVLFVFPASAKDIPDQVEKSYKKLTDIFEHIISVEILGSAKFYDLSPESKEYLKENGVDTEAIGIAYYTIDPEDNVLVLNSITLENEENNDISISSLTTFGEDESGEFKKTHNTALRGDINITGSLSWSSVSFSGSVVHSNKITISASLYTSQSYYVDTGAIVHRFFKPYQTTLTITKYNNQNPSVTDYSGTTYVIGHLRYTDGTSISSYYIWSTYYGLGTPTIGHTYSRINYLPSNQMIEVNDGDFSSVYHFCTFTLDNSHNNSATVIIYF